MEFKINFIFIICIIIALMFTFSVVFAVIDSIKQIKQEKTKEKQVANAGKPATYATC